MDSSLQRVVLTSSTSGSHSNRRLAAQSAKNSWFANNPILLPILIGGAGGLLVVLLLLAMVFMASRPTTFDVDVRAPSQEMPGLEEVPPEPAPPGVVGEPAAEAVPPRAEDTGAEGPDEESERPSEPDAEREAATPERDEFPETERPDVPPADAVEPKIAAAPEDAATEPEDAPDEAERPPVADIVTRADADALEADPQDSADEERPPEESRDPRQVLAQLERLNVELTGGPGRTKLPPDFLQFLQTAIAAIDRITSDTTQQLGLELDQEAPALLSLELVTDFSPERVAIHLRGKLTLDEGEDQAGEGLPLWSHERELARVSGRFNRTVLSRLARENIQRFFQEFQRHVTEARDPTPSEAAGTSAN